LNTRLVPKTSETGASTGGENCPDHSRSGALWLNVWCFHALVFLDFLLLLMARFRELLGNRQLHRGILRRPDHEVSPKAGPAARHTR